MTKLMRRSEKTQADDPGSWDPMRGTLSRIDPFRMVREMFQDPFGGMGLLATETAFRPNLDVTEGNDSFVINVDLPGVNEDDLDVQVTGNRLTVSGQREAEETREGERYVAIERSYGSFSRSFVLPDSADLENVQAQLRNGVLEIKVPKRHEMKGRKVSIQGAAKPAQVEIGAAPEQAQMESQAPTAEAEAPRKKAA
jgi:HSP20 family protein